MNVHNNNYVSTKHFMNLIQSSSQNSFSIVTITKTTHFGKIVSSKLLITRSGGSWDYNFDFNMLPMQGVEKLTISHEEYSYV